MTTSFIKIMIAATMASTALIRASLTAITAAKARPPTAQFSSGYEARLAEARKAAQFAAKRRAVGSVTKPHHQRID
jgi:hypothetical protein